MVFQTYNVQIQISIKINHNSRNITYDYLINEPTEQSVLTKRIPIGGYNYYVKISFLFFFFDSVL